MSKKSSLVKKPSKPFAPNPPRSMEEIDKDFLKFSQELGSVRYERAAYESKEQDCLAKMNLIVLEANMRRKLNKELDSKKVQEPVKVEA